jgi:bifunctional DNase/RNase
LVWLKDKEQRLFLPIAIGSFEATAIYMELYNEPPPRPISYDLMRSVLDGLKAHVEFVVINDLREDTFFAEVTVEQGDKRVEIDSRPSDAIALALRVGAPIFVEELVLREAGLAVEGDGASVPGLSLDDESPVPEPPAVADLPPGRVESQVISLKARLQEAVSREAYEEAALLRDEIGRLEQRLSG